MIIHITLIRDIDLFIRDIDLYTGNWSLYTGYWSLYGILISHIRILIPIRDIDLCIRDIDVSEYWSLIYGILISIYIPLYMIQSKRHTISDNHCIVKRFCIIYVWYTVPVSVRYRMSDIAWYRVKRPFWCRSLSLIWKKAFLIQRLTLYILYQQGLSLHQTKTSISERPFRSISKGPADTECVWCSLIWEVGGWGRDPFSRNFMKPTPRRKWYLTTGRRFH